MIKKVIKDYLSSDSVLMDNVSNVFTFFDASNTRRTNGVVNKGLFPMITIRQFDRLLTEGHESGSARSFESTLEIQLDTINNPDACNSKAIQKIQDIEDQHESSVDRIIYLLHSLSGDVGGTIIGMCVFQDANDTQASFNLVNNDKDQYIQRTTLIFNINYEQGA